MIEILSVIILLIGTWIGAYFSGKRKEKAETQKKQLEETLNAKKIEEDSRGLDDAAVIQRMRDRANKR